MRKIDTLTFLNMLYENMPENLFLTIWTKNPTQTFWVSTSDLRAAEHKIAELSTAGVNVYFGVGAGNRKKYGRLKSAEILCIPGVWMDMDVAGPAHKQTDLPPNIDAARALLDAVPYEPTLIINSGHGLHAYWLFREPWVLDTPEEHAEAQKILVALQTVIQQRAAGQGYKLDSTHDLARVLRPVGSKNYKAELPPADVTVVSHTDNRFNPDDLDGVLPDITISTLEKHDKFKRLPSDGPAEDVIKNCIFMQVCAEHAHELTEPQWVAMISNIARCKDGPAVVHELSRPYPGYSEKETDDKIYHCLNDMHPQTCQYIQSSLGFNQCPGNCGVKAPVGWALSKAKKQANTEKPVPDGFFDVDTAPGTDKIDKFTDLGNAEYFSRYYNGKVKYCTQMDKWLIWDGCRWVVDGANQITVLAGKCVRSMYDHISSINDDDQKKKLFNHAMKSEDARRLASMVKLARGYMPVSVDELDQDPWLLNSPSGIIDLKTGELLQHDPKKNMTKMITATYDPLATCPVFENFIDGVFDGNKNIISFMQRFLGYCLTGDTREQQFIIAFGDGRNGKGTLLNLISEILADYAKNTPTEVLYSKKFDKPSNDVARLAGARFVLASEGEKGKKFDEPLIKKMTGQDLLAARFLYKETFEFMPQFKLCMMTNDKPVASEDDAALWARIQLVPFVKKFEGAAQDKTLKYRLREPQELSGILQWLIRGCLEWQRVGLQPPEEVISATREYRSENDKIQDWMDECCVVDEKAVSSPKELYKNFQAWSLENGERFILIHKNFIKGLARKGFNQVVGTGNRMKMPGISVAAQVDEHFNQHERPF